MVCPLCANHNVGKEMGNTAMKKKFKIPGIKFYFYRRERGQHPNT